MEDSFFELSRVDAVAMERLSSSPYIMDMFGFCGMSAITDYAPTTITQLADSLEPKEKLRLAIQVATGLSHVHGIDGGQNISLVHNDINLSSLLAARGRNGNFVPIFNDFNIAILRMWNKKTKDICPFASRFPNPQVS